MIGYTRMTYGSDNNIALFYIYTVAADAFDRSNASLIVSPPPSDVKFSNHLSPQSPPISCHAHTYPSLPLAPPIKTKKRNGREWKGREGTRIYSYPDWGCPSQPAFSNSVMAFRRVFFFWFQRYDILRWLYELQKSWLIGFREYF